MDTVFQPYFLAYMRLLYIINNYSFGGLNRVTSEKANYFLKKGYEVHLLCTDNSSEIDVKSIYAAGVVHHTIDRKKLNRLQHIPVVGKMLRFIYYRIKMLMILLFVNPDTIIVTLPVLEPLSILILTFWKRRIMEFHGYYTPPGFSITKNDKFAFKYRFAFYHLYALTEREAKIVSNLSHHPVGVMPNPLYELPQNYSDCTAKNVITTARFCYQKNLDSIIPYWKQIEDRHPDWQLLLMGRGDDKEKMQATITDNHLKTVKILPYSTDVGSKLVNSSIFILPSRFEGFPLVLLECMSYGVPAVAYDCPCGPTEIIRDGFDGFVTEYMNPQALMDKVQMLIENEMLRKEMGQRARKDIQRYKLDVIMGKWENIYRGTLAKE